MTVDADRLVELRRTLHRNPELSNRECHTASLLKAFLDAFPPNRWVNGLGGEGFAAIYEGAQPGPRVLVRADLDALPIAESLGLDHGSRFPGISHKCGHDGHMAMLAGVAAGLHVRRPRRGTAVLLFQPAEETGEGAARVIADPKFALVAPDFVFALHNLPGFAFGSVVLRDGFFASASRGLVIELQGASSHAAEPHLGSSPALAVASLIQALSACPQTHTALHDAAQVTIVHARVGDVAFGTSPGHGVVMATLRTHATQVMESLGSRCLDLAQGIGRAHGLQIKTRWTEEFPATVNDPGAVAHLRSAAAACSLPVVEAPLPFPWSEDFGHFTSHHPGALFGLGSGTNHPPLHHPTYDFPDDLLPTGVRLLLRLIHETLGDTAPSGGQPA